MKSSHRYFKIFLIVLWGFIVIEFFSIHADAQENEIYWDRLELSEREEVEIFYHEGVKLYKIKKYHEALKKFQEVEKLDKAYRSTWSFIQRINGHIAFEEKKRLEAQAEAMKQKAEEERLVKERGKRIEKVLSAEQRRIGRNNQERERLAEKEAAEEQKRRAYEQKVIEAKLKKKQKVIEGEQKNQLNERKRLDELAEVKEREEQQRLLEIRRAEEENRLQHNQLVTAFRRIRKENSQDDTYQEIQNTSPQTEIDSPKRSSIEPKSVSGETITRNIGEYVKESKGDAVKKTIVHDKKKIKQAKVLFRQTIASAKAKRFQHARDSLDEFINLIQQPNFPVLYRTKMFDKAVEAKNFINDLAEREELRIAHEERKEAARHARAQREANIRNLKDNEQIVIRHKSFDTDKKENPYLARVALQRKLESRQEFLKKEWIRQQNEIKFGKKTEDMPLRKASIAQYGRSPNSNPSAASPMKPYLQKDRLKESLLEEIDNLYLEGLALYQEGSLMSARNMLLEVDKTWPDYKLAKHYLNIINYDLYASQHKTKTYKPAYTYEPTSISSRDQIVNNALDVYSAIRR